jgi:hypothetical protein
MFRDWADLVFNYDEVFPLRELRDACSLAIAELRWQDDLRPGCWLPKL